MVANKKHLEGPFVQRGVCVFWVIAAFLVGMLTGVMLTKVFVGEDEAPETVIKGKDFNVDLVYLWCDGSEPAFAARKAEWLEKEGKKQPKTTVASGRFVQVDEMKYSLRSVEKYLPWIHHIYIVTDRQVPKWLNTKHPKITVVDHSEIIPKKYIPTFNSHAIEASVYKIPGLSEHFLLANDDMFFNRPIGKDFFFPERGKVNIRFRKRKSILGGAFWYRTLLNSINLIERDFGDLGAFSEKDLETHHSVDGYLKSDYKACAEHYNKEYTKTISHKFRKEKDVHHSMVSVFSYLKKHANLVIVNKKPYTTPEGRDSWFFMNTGWEKYGKTLAKVNPALFCLNDTGISTDEMREQTRLFLENYFPDKSQFEK